MLVGEDREELLMICRTNGALERFNRELNHAFPNACLSMSEFVRTIRRISAEDKYTEWLRARTGPPLLVERIERGPIRFRAEAGAI